MKKKIIISLVILASAVGLYVILKKKKAVIEIGDLELVSFDDREYVDASGNPLTKKYVVTNTATVGDLITMLGKAGTAGFTLSWFKKYNPYYSDAKNSTIVQKDTTITIPISAGLIEKYTL